MAEFCGEGEEVGWLVWCGHRGIGVGFERCDQGRKVSVA